MKPKKTIKFLYVWTLILVFTSSVVLKGFHYHDSSYHGKAKVSASHEASVKQICSVCDFAMHKATEAKPLVFVPVVNATTVKRVSMPTVKTKAVGFLDI